MHFMKPLQKYTKRSSLQFALNLVLYFIFHVHREINCQIFLVNIELDEYI